MAKFKCNQSGNVFEFFTDHDIKTMRTHCEYTELSEELVDTSVSEQKEKTSVELVDTSVELVDTSVEITSSVKPKKAGRPPKSISSTKEIEE